MSRRLAALGATLVLCFAIVACGDDDSGDGAATTSPPAEGETKRVVIEAEDGAFDPHAVYEAASPGVVTVISIFDESPAASILGGDGGEGQGSGFVISDEGEILTNAHVVTDADQPGQRAASINEADEVYIKFADLNTVEAEVVGFDPYADVALLRIDPDALDLVPLPLGSERDVAVGEPLAAIGSPFGQAQSLSVGIVSAIDRPIQGLTRFQIDSAIQTDASINPGNSGGPLLDAEGQVVGINQQIRTASGGNEGVGFAVPIDLAERSIEQLREDGEASYAYAGVSTMALYPQLAERLDYEITYGALVSEVVEGSPADEAGLRGGERFITFQGTPETPVGADVITAIDGEELERSSDLSQAISRHEPGDEVTLDVFRDGDSIEVELTLGDREDALR